MFIFTVIRKWIPRGVVQFPTCDLGLFEGDVPKAGCWRIVVKRYPCGFGNIFETHHKVNLNVQVLSVDIVYKMMVFN